MLQPPQLVDVFSQYPEEIAELQLFLSKAGVAIGAPDAIGAVAARLQRDKAFHRDLTTSLWMLTEGGDRSIGYAHLLGMLAIAAAGLELASAAEEQDALTLLRFLKQSRETRSPEPLSTRGSALSQNSVSQTDLFALKALDPKLLDRESVPHTIEQPPSPDERQSIARRSALHASPIRLQAEHPDPVRRRTPLLIAGACAVAALLLVLWLHRRPAASLPGDAQPVASGSGSSSPPAAFASSGRRGTVPARTAPAATFTPPRSSAAPTSSSVTLSPAPRDTPVPVPDAVPALHSPVSQAAVEVPSPASHVASAPAAAALPPSHAIAKSGSVAVVPASTLSKRLGTQTLPQAVDTGAEAPRRPHLLRRHPASGDQPTLLAELDPADNPIRRPGQISAAGQAPLGTVHPTALGMMAANVLYSPAPSYPQAASAAHVTGEVKLQAEVDRDGNVTYARVVSGPPLLRDAALNAVQQWRYRPYLSRGKAVPMTALAVMDFQLP